MKIFDHYLDRDESIKRIILLKLEIETCYKRGLVEKGLGAVVIQRNWRIEHNPFDGWHRSKRITYETIQQLERFKSVPINVIGIDDEILNTWKIKSLIGLINEYGTERVISTEIFFNPFWFYELQNPSWRFFWVVIQPWNQPNAEEMVAVFKLLADLVKL